MDEKEFIKKLEGYRIGLDLIEDAFPGMFTNYEKVTIILRMQSCQCLVDIENLLMDNAGHGLTDRLCQLVEAFDNK